MKKIILCLSALPVIAFANTQFAKQCQVSGIKYSHKSVSLFSQHTAKPRLYAIENTSKHPIWLNHQRKQVGMGAGWASELFPNHWSALLVTKRVFGLQCQIAKKSGGMPSVPCKKVLHVCQFGQFDSKNPMMGGYWVVENVLFPALEPRMRKRGFKMS